MSATLDREKLVRVRFNFVYFRIAFDKAKTVFSDVLGRLISDPEHSEGEERYILMGMSSQFRILTVCHCERNFDTIRIISARKADKFEQKLYEAYNHA